MAHQILVIEDEAAISRLVELHLRDAGCEVTTVSTVAAALALADRGAFDLVVLDLMLPDGDGLDVCRALRRRGDYTPILVLTARSSEVDRVVGLELGADDYLTKPFSVRELVARVKAILRRVEQLAASSGAPEGEALEIDGLAVDRARRRVCLDGVEVQLTAREFDLLAHFATHPGRVYTRSELLSEVWGYGAGVYEHTVNSHINRLRAKVERDPAKPRFVQTVWGVGYRFLEPSALRAS